MQFVINYQTSSPAHHGNSEYDGNQYFAIEMLQSESLGDQPKNTTASQSEAPLLRWCDHGQVGLGGFLCRHSSRGSGHATPFVYIFLQGL